MPIAPTVDEQRLIDFLSRFGGNAEVQSSHDADIDSQLKTVATLLSVRLDAQRVGSIIDLGCGNGILLRRLSELAAFTENKEIIYVAVDEPKSLTAVQDLARELRLHRRLEPIPLTEFYQQWPAAEQAPRPLTIFCRNVLHELNIGDTAKLLSAVYGGITEPDLFIIQDFQVFPQSEHRNACWDIECLISTCREIGFDSSVTEEPTKSGNRWFNLVLKKSASSKSRSAKESVFHGRLKQWEKWQGLGILTTTDEKLRGAQIAKLDFELQFAALTFQLRQYPGSRVSALEPAQEKIILHKTFSRLVAKFIAAEKIEKREINEVVRHFRGFGPQLNVLEEFLRSPGRFASIIGGRGTGKSTIARHLLSMRSHHRTGVFVELQEHPSAWSLIEKIFSSVGLRLPIELLSGLDSIRLADIETDLRGFFNRFAKALLIYVDDLDRAIDWSGKFADKEVERVFELLMGCEGAKLIVGHRPVPISTFVFPASEPGKQFVARVGRFGDDASIINILDDYVDRASLNVGDYPPRLIAAIDRHPALAELAGRYIQKAGWRVLDDKFLRLLELNMRSHLWRRMIGPTERPAMDAFSHLRIATPKFFLEQFSSGESVATALDSGLLYEIPDHRWRTLVDGINVLRLRRLSDDGEHLYSSDATNRKSKRLRKTAARKREHYERPSTTKLLSMHLTIFTGRMTIPSGYARRTSI